VITPGGPSRGRTGDRPKLLVTTTTLPRFEADPEPRFVLDLSRELGRRFDVTVLAPADPAAALEETLEGVRVLRYWYAPARSMETLAYPGAVLPRIRDKPARAILVPMLVAGLYLAVRRLMAAERFDCVHAHWLVPQGAVQWMASGPDAPPYVVTSHGGDVSSLNNRWITRLGCGTLSRAAAATAVSRDAADTMRRRFGPSLPPGDVAFIPMGASLKRFNPRFRDDGWAEAHGFARPLLLFVGRLAEKKGLTVLLKAMASETLRRTGAHLAIIGDGPLRQQLENEARTLVVADRVRFLGPTCGESLHEAFASADVFCAPSVIARNGDCDGTPTVLIEAAASGIPSVASDVGGIADLVVNGTTGRVVPPGDVDALAGALAEYLADADLRRAHGAAARHHSRAYDWSNIGGRYGDLIAEVIARHRAEPADTVAPPVRVAAGSR